MGVTFYATFGADHVRPYIPAGIPVLIPASSYARYRKADGAIKPVDLPDQVTERAADCGGYVATKIWGDYRYTQEEYVEWLRSFRPQWAAMMDYCCEPDIATNAEEIRTRQKRTTENAYRMWQEFRQEPVAWVPTLKGWHPRDYIRHAEELSPLIREMAEHYQGNEAFRVGIGTLCQRDNVALIKSVVKAVRSVVPDQPLHLWGVKARALAGREALPGNIVSVDSAAWGWSAHVLCRGTGMNSREYSLKIMLPEYIRNFNQRLSNPRQGALEFD